MAVTGFPVLVNRSEHRRQARVIAATLWLVGSLLTAFSVGLFDRPSAAAMATAAVRDDL
jgi:hypothetical protein